MNTNLVEFESEAWKKIPNVYNTTEERLQDDVIILEKWLETQKHLPEIMDRICIKQFLLRNKCSIERSKEKIDWYYTIRAKIPEFYKISNPKLEPIQSAMNLLYFIVLPKLTPDLNRVLMYKVRKPELAHMMDPYHNYALNLAIIEIRMFEDIYFKEICILDFKGMSLGYFNKLTPSILKRMVEVSEKVYSMRLSAMYFINSPPILSNAVSLLKSIMKPKIFNRIHVFQDDQIPDVPKAILPVDYGGEEKSLDELREVLVKKFTEYQKRFDDLDEMRVNEELRPQKLKNDDDLGFHGNFKTLNLD